VELSSRVAVVENKQTSEERAMTRSIIISIAATFLLLSAGIVNAQTPATPDVTNDDKNSARVVHDDDLDYGWLGLIGLLGLAGLGGRRRRETEIRTTTPRSGI